MKIDVDCSLIVPHVFEIATTHSYIEGFNCLNHKAIGWTISSYIFPT